MKSPILAKFVQAAARKLGVGLISAPVSVPSAGEFYGNFFATRRMSPAEVRMTLEQAAQGSIQAQWELFAMMEDTWPRLAKNLSELRRAAARATYAVQPYADRGTTPTTTAKDKAALVEKSMRQWWPRPGTLELGFEDTLFHGLDAFGKGVSVLEVQWQQLPGALVPRCAHVLSSRAYGWNADCTELGLAGADGQTWQPFPPGHFLVGIWYARTGAPAATAVLRVLAPFWAGVTFGWEWLLSTAQIFGVPFRWATFDKNHPELGAVLRDMLAAMGASGYGAFPDGTKLEFKEAATNAQGNPQVVLQELANQACDLVILGQELSGAAQAAGLGGGAAGLQQSVRADRLQDAAQWCANLLNYQLVPAVLRANWGNTEEPPTIVPDLDAEPDPVKLAQRDELLLRAGVAMPRAWFYERHGIPEPIAGEAVIAGSARAAAAPAAPGEDGEGDPKDPDSPEDIAEDTAEADSADKNATKAGGRGIALNALAGTKTPAGGPKGRKQAVQGPCKAVAAKDPGLLSPLFDAKALREIVLSRADEIGPVLDKFEAALAISDPEQRAAACRALQESLPASLRRISPASPLATAIANATSTAAVAAAVETASKP
ncbi:DUF935 family protein [Opitutus sp. ER46]|uniref:phage portal protein family protein n=1 Tax=Opitutus sp. ER46 TaxID=2161864 RepID=UPI000D3059C7|nr:DUF935 family protein [Opitutus sp. ER46]PTX95761.1 hypothetical protein DB354_10140 [Opitutus sp. ER46]